LPIHTSSASCARCDVTLQIYVETYFLSNSLHSNVRKYTSNNIYTLSNTCNIKYVRIMAPLLVGHYLMMTIWNCKEGYIRRYNPKFPETSSLLSMVSLTYLTKIIRFPSVMFLKKPVWHLSIGSSCGTTSS